MNRSLLCAAICLLSLYSGKLTGQSLPETSPQNKCYVRCVEQDVLDYYTVEYLTYDAEEAALYPNEMKRIMISEEHKVWEAIRREGCKSKDENDCILICQRIFETVYDTVYLPKDSTVGNPYRYGMFVEEVVRRGGFSSYQEVDCELTSYVTLPIAFQNGSSILLAESYSILDDRLVNLLLDLSPEITIQLNIHTSCKGDADDNQLLSEARASSIVEYLSWKGVNPLRVLVRGYGESQPVRPCIDGIERTVADQRTNQRVQFRVLDM